jgi:hypothetical protein
MAVKSDEEDGITEAQQILAGFDRPDESRVKQLLDECGRAAQEEIEEAYRHEGKTI